MERKKSGKGREKSKRLESLLTCALYFTCPRTDNSLTQAGLPHLGGKKRASNLNSNSLKKPTNSCTYPKKRVAKKYRQKNCCKKSHMATLLSLSPHPFSTTLLFIWQSQFFFFFQPPLPPSAPPSLSPLWEYIWQGEYQGFFFFSPEKREQEQILFKDLKKQEELIKWLGGRGGGICEPVPKTAPQQKSPRKIAKSWKNKNKDSCYDWKYLVLQF